MRQHNHAFALTDRVAAQRGDHGSLTDPRWNHHDGSVARRVGTEMILNCVDGFKLIGSELHVCDQGRDQTKNCGQTDRAPAPRWGKLVGWMNEVESKAGDVNRPLQRLRMQPVVRLHDVDAVRTATLLVTNVNNEPLAMQLVGAGKTRNTDRLAQRREFLL